VQSSPPRRTPSLEEEMEKYQANLLQSLRAVDEFLASNAHRLDGVVNTGARQKLAETLAALDANATEQAGGTLASQGTTQLTRALRRALVRDHMAPIARMARAELPPMPEAHALRPPRPNWPLARLHAAAHGMAEATAPYRAELVKAGLREDFVEALTAAADAMVQSVTDRAQSRGRVSGATRGLRTSLSSGRKLVAVLDALVARTLADDPALLANWKRVKRVRRMASHAARRSELEPSQEILEVAVDHRPFGGGEDPARSGSRRRSGRRREGGPRLAHSASTQGSSGALDLLAEVVAGTAPRLGASSSPAVVLPLPLSLLTSAHRGDPIGGVVEQRRGGEAGAEGRQLVGRLGGALAGDVVLPQAGGDVGQNRDETSERSRAGRAGDGDGVLVGGGEDRAQHSAPIIRLEGVGAADEGGEGPGRDDAGARVLSRSPGVVEQREAAGSERRDELLDVLRGFDAEPDEAVKRGGVLEAEDAAGEVDDVLAIRLVLAGGGLGGLRRSAGGLELEEPHERSAGRRGELTERERVQAGDGFGPDVDVGGGEAAGQRVGAADLRRRAHQGRGGEAADDRRGMQWVAEHGDEVASHCSESPRGRGPRR
jgi:hypothetical protein